MRAKAAQTIRGIKMTRFDVNVTTIRRGLLVETKVEAIAKSSVDAGNLVLHGLGIEGNFKIKVTKKEEVLNA